MIFFFCRRKAWFAAVPLHASDAHLCECFCILFLERMHVYIYIYVFMHQVCVCVGTYFFVFVFRLESIYCLLADCSISRVCVFVCSLWFCGPIIACPRTRMSHAGWTYRCCVSPDGFHMNDCSNARLNCCRSLCPLAAVDAIPHPPHPPSLSGPPPSTWCRC